MGETIASLCKAGESSFMIEYNKSYVEYEEGDPLEVDTKEDLIEKIKQCEKIAIIRGHGGYEGTSLSYITITDKAETDQETLSSDDVYADNIYDMDLSNIEIILYVGCSTAGNYNTAGARNLLNSSVAHGGALISVGFPRLSFVETEIRLQQLLQVNMLLQPMRHSRSRLIYPRCCRMRNSGVIGDPYVKPQMWRN